MTRWHTDAPVRSLPALRAITPVSRVAMFRSDGPARASLRVAQAYWKRKLRQRAEAKRTAFTDRS